MIEFDLGIAEQLTQVTTTSSVQVRVGTSNSDLVIASIIQPLIQNFGMGGVYITASQTAPNVIEMMNTIGLDVSPIHFIDCVSSGILGGTQNPYPNIGYIDSPIMLESMMLRTLHHLENSQIQQNFVILDSVNALSIYNEERILAEYLHTFINTCKNRQVLSLIVNVPDQTPAGVLSNLDLYCSDLIDRGQVVIS
tara:strand:+ start:3123 stop:3707 length:585 start_codon:yes stop_codon:yes gene_type:complete